MGSIILTLDTLFEGWNDWIARNTPKQNFRPNQAKKDKTNIIFTKPITLRTNILRNIGNCMQNFEKWIRLSNKNWNIELNFVW